MYTYFKVFLISVFFLFIFNIPLGAENLGSNARLISEQNIDEIPSKLDHDKRLRQVLEERYRKPLPPVNKFDESLLNPVNPQDEVTVTYEGSTLWSGMNDVVVSGDYAYCAMNYGLMIIDVSDVTNPSFVSKLYLQDEGWGVAVAV